MNKSDLVKELAEHMSINPKIAEKVVNISLDSIVKALRKGQRVEIRGFGNFKMKDYKAYTGRNPKTGEHITVKPKRLPFFKAGKDMKDRVNTSVKHS